MVVKQPLQIKNGDIMEYELLKSKLNETNVVKIELISSDGDSTFIKKDDKFRYEGDYILIKRGNDEISLSLNEIYKVIVHRKKHVSPKIVGFDSNRGRY